MYSRVTCEHPLLVDSLHNICTILYRDVATVDVYVACSITSDILHFEQCALCSE